MSTAVSLADEQYPMGPVSNWLSVYELWKRRNSCVHVLPDSTPVAKASAFAPLQETVLEVKTEATVVTPRKGKLSKPDLETIFAKEAWRYYTICPSLSDFSKFLAGAVSCVYHRVPRMTDNTARVLYCWVLEQLLQRMGRWAW